MHQAEARNLVQRPQAASYEVPDSRVGPVVRKQRLIGPRNLCEVAAPSRTSAELMRVFACDPASFETGDSFTMKPIQEMRIGVEVLVGGEQLSADVLHREPVECDVTHF